MQGIPEELVRSVGDRALVPRDVSNVVDPLGLFSRERVVEPDSSTRIRRRLLAFDEPQEQSLLFDLTHRLEQTSGQGVKDRRCELVRLAILPDEQVKADNVTFCDR